MTLAADHPTQPTEAVTAVTMVGERYELGRVIGQGGMATVYDAVDTRTSNRVAVKVFRPGVELSDSLPRRQREVQMASALHHPAIVSIIDADVDEPDEVGGCAYIVSELVTGPTLGQRLHRQPLTVDQVAGLGATLCDALSYMHAAGIVHRDLKPANILLRGDTDDDLAHPKLTDFGLAFMLDSTRMTSVGLTAGTANYLSPEQVRGMSITPACDIYALGLVLIEALTGRPVFAGHGIEAAVVRLSSNPVPPSNIEAGLAELLTAMTAIDPAQRPTAVQVRARLAAVGQGRTLTSDLVGISCEPEQSVRPTRRWRPFGVAASALVVLFAGLIAAIAIPLTGGFGGSGRSPTLPADAATNASTTTGPAGPRPASSPAATDQRVAMGSTPAAGAPQVSTPPSTMPVGVGLAGAKTASKTHGKKGGDRKP